MNNYMNNLIFCSASFHIKHVNNDLRENEYYFCIQQLLRFLPKNFEIVICDNSIKTIDNIKNQNLKNTLSKIRFLILDKNIGESNIGMGELDELIYVSNNIEFNKYDKIVYMTLRKIVTTPWVFEKVNTMTKDALLSNPPILRLSSNYNFHYYPVNNELYNDMFFTLSSKLMLEYVNYSKDRIDFNLKNHVGSEQNLYKFINENKIEYEWLECLGFIRIDYKSKNEIQLI